MLKIASDALINQIDIHVSNNYIMQISYPCHWINSLPQHVPPNIFWFCCCVELSMLGPWVACDSWWTTKYI